MEALTGVRTMSAVCFTRCSAALSLLSVVVVVVVICAIYDTFCAYFGKFAVGPGGEGDMAIERGFGLAHFLYNHKFALACLLQGFFFLRVAPRTLLSPSTPV